MWASPPADPMHQAAERSATHLGFDPNLLRTQEDDPLRDLGLREQQDGSLLYVDPFARFTARFNPDGTVHFADRWKRPARSDPDKGACCALPPDGFNPLFARMSGPVEWLIKAQGKDVLAREKAELLERTRPMRIQQAIAFTRRLIAARLADLDGELEVIASDAEREVDARRRLLFERWDECDERFSVAPPGIPDEALSEIDSERLHAATVARRRIEALIRRRFPAGTARAYDAGTIDTLNARRVSHEAFDPYTERPMPAPRPAAGADPNSAPGPDEPVAPPPEDPRDHD